MGPMGSCMRLCTMLARCPNADHKARQPVCTGPPCQDLEVCVRAGGPGAQWPGLGVQQVRREEPGHGLL